WKQRMRAGIIDRYVELKKLEREDNDAYRLEVKRIRIEDGMFAAMADYRTAMSQEQKDKAKQQMRQRAAEFIDNRQAERRLRLDRLEAQAKLLRTEIKKVDDEKETQVTALTDQSLRPVRGHHRGPSGPAGPGHRGERRGGK